MDDKGRSCAGATVLIVSAVLKECLGINQTRGIGFQLRGLINSKRTHGPFPGNFRDIYVKF